MSRESVPVGGHLSGFAATHRGDRWWVAPVLTVLGFGSFIIYATWAALQGEHYFAAPYLSPFYSPVLFVETAAAGAVPLDHAWLGSWPAWWPAFLPVSPALFILIFPGAFRGTCYYYRKAYYRSFFSTPPACGVGRMFPSRYRGETALLVIQNVHRYTLYFALLFIAILTYDAGLAFFKDGEFGIGVGSIILLINPVLLSLYTFGCHSLRHLIGGRLDCFSCDRRSEIRYGLWESVSALNARHMEFAWLSLIWVGLTDLYVRLVSMGIIRDLNTWG
jgi:hypothetical protein